MSDDLRPLKPYIREILYQDFGKKLREDIPMARHTTARVGGPADYLIEVHSTVELVEIASVCWRHQLPFIILGGGSNVIVSDAGIRGLVILNQASRVRFSSKAKRPRVWAESGANFGLIARKAGLNGLSGLEWAAGIPGTIGGAIVGNAGAHGSDISANLISAEVIQKSVITNISSPRPEKWSVDKFGYSYRSSILKQNPGEVIVLSAQIQLEHSTPELARAKMDEFTEKRRRTQPPGASMGSMFKNPAGDYAGRLIEAVGLKGKRIGNAEISTLHANFFINLGQATAEDIHGLLQIARSQVLDKFGIHLELEIQMIGEW